MAAELLIGAAFSELQKVLTDVIKTIVHFNSTLTNLEDTVKVLKPIFDDIEKNQKVLDRPPVEINMFADKMKKGTNLIRICSKIKSWNLYKRYVFANKLQDFDSSLTTFFQREIQAYQVKGILEANVVVNDILNEVIAVKAIVCDVNEKVDSIRWNGSSFTSSTSSWSLISSCDFDDLPEFIVGLDVPLENLKELLLKDRKNISSPVVSATTVLLSAPPGCGKTTLANMVCQDDKIKDIFKENIFFVKVSKKANIKAIVQKIFQHKGCQDLPDNLDDSAALNQLKKLLKEIGGKPDGEPILLVLDDVWSPGLETFVEKFRFKGIPGYKLLVTSRSESQAFDSMYRLDLLSHQDAKALFCHSAFPPQSRHPHVSDDIVDKIVRACKRFPLALNTVSLSLRGKPEAKWNATLDKWATERSNILDSNAELLNNLKTSLDALDEEKDMETVKECFLDLGSFPEDQRISSTGLMDMWVELYELDEEGLYTFDNLHELSTRNLLNFLPTRNDDSSSLNGYCYGQFVTQHDMLRELAIYLNKQEPVEQRKRLIMDIAGEVIPKKWVERLKPPLLARLLSITTDDSFTSSWCDMELPEDEVLILNFQARNFTLPPFMERMGKLKVLIVTNYGLGPAELINFPVVGYLSSLKRIRLEHVSISSCLGASSAIQVMNLEKISLIMCEIGKAFDNCAYMFPNLKEIEMEYCRDLVQLPTGLCDIIHLERISITCCNELNSLSLEIGRLINLKSLRLNSCTSLEGLPDTFGSLEKLSLLDISDCLSIDKLPTRMGDLRGLRTLHMRNCWGLFELPPSVEDLKNLRVICDIHTAYLWEFYTNVNIFLVKEDKNLDWLDD